MLPKIDQDQIVVVYMTTEHNPDMLVDNPPIMRQEYDDPSLAAEAKLSALNSARFWDIYKEVVQLSFRWKGKNVHFLLCDDLSISQDKSEMDTDTRMVVWCMSEEELIKKAFNFLWEVYGGENQDGKTMFYRLLAGWETHRTIWPLLANRALKYRVKAPSAMLTDPERRWPTVYGLVDLSTIYSQAGGNSRYMPSLGDVLSYWGFWEEGMGPRVSNIRDVLCDKPWDVVNFVEPYLVGMDEVMKQYYGVQPPVYSELAGVPVPPALPVEFYPERN